MWLTSILAASATLSATLLLEIYFAVFCGFVERERERESGRVADARSRVPVRPAQLESLLHQFVTAARHDSSFGGPHGGVSSLSWVSLSHGLASPLLRQGGLLAGASSLHAALALAAEARGLLA